MLVPELMVSFLLPLHFYLSNNGTRLFDSTTNVSAGANGKCPGTTTILIYPTMVPIGYLTTQQMLVPELMVNFPLPLHINLSNNCTNRLLDYGQA